MAFNRVVTFSTQSDVALLERCRRARGDRTYTATCRAALEAIDPEPALQSPPPRPGPPKREVYDPPEALRRSRRARVYEAWQALGGYMTAAAALGGQVAAVAALAEALAEAGHPGALQSAARLGCALRAMSGERDTFGRVLRAVRAHGVSRWFVEAAPLPF